jgi:hypothetical protein
LAESTALLGAKIAKVNGLTKLVIKYPFPPYCKARI